MEFCSKTEIAASGDQEGVVTIFETNNFKIREKVELGGGITGMLFSKRRESLFVSGVEGTLWRINGKSGEIEKVMEGHRNIVLGFVVNSKEDTLISVSDDSRCLLFSNSY